ncbi:DNA primase small subunit-like isoform X2 [Chelonus insularis]|uniref:DNA primase small subunit-like isoform X2 n=1 Tax=Chelonus insularis TaxID=460826 RepID=UPI00158B871E|nr:DNA primase small subunit-like isoform X2 [Chelonus insularis]
MNIDEYTLRRYLKEYYMKIFPCKYIQLWLSYGNAEKFHLREFSFTSIFEEFSRYIVFNDEEEMRKTLARQIPAKLDVGPAFNIMPIFKNKDKLIPLKKEIVIDIDINDYGDIRTCCSDAKLCRKCWKYMAIACKIIDTSLREDWGFQNILWVFSGRRGIHAWICDPEIQEYSSSKRAGIADFFQLVNKNAFGRYNVKIKRMNRFIERTIIMINEIFVPMCVVEQDLLGNTNRIEKFVNLLPSSEVKQEVEKLFQAHTTSLDRWNAFVDYYQTQIESGNKVWLENSYFMEKIKIIYCYPRLDRNVTIAFNHLLKLPFSMHPKTGKISIPFDPKQVDIFNPQKIPTCN